MSFSFFIFFFGPSFEDHQSHPRVTWIRIVASLSLPLLTYYHLLFHAHLEKRSHPIPFPIFFFLKQRFTNDRQGMYNIKDNNKNSCKTKIQSASFLFQVVEKTSYRGYRSSRRCCPVCPYSQVFAAGQLAHAVGPQPFGVVPNVAVIHNLHTEKKEKFSFSCLRNNCWVGGWKRQMPKEKKKTQSL
jgi:hypothetical protein